MAVSVVFKSEAERLRMLVGEAEDLDEVPGISAEVEVADSCDKEGMASVTKDETCICPVEHDARFFWCRKTLYIHITWITLAVLFFFKLVVDSQTEAEYLREIETGITFSYIV